MIKRPLIAFLLVASGALYAQSRSETEAELRTRMAIIQRTLDESVKDRAKLAVALAKVNTTTKVVAENQAQSAVDVAAAAQVVALKLAETKEAAARTAKEALDAAAAAQAATASARAQNAALLIVQSCALFALLLGILERLWNRRKDREKEARDHAWKLEAELREKSMASAVDEVHALVNSAYTAALMDTLAEMKACLILLRANVILLRAVVPRDEVSIAEVTAQSLIMSSKIAELTKTLALRAKQAGDPVEATGGA